MLNKISKWLCNRIGLKSYFSATPKKSRINVTWAGDAYVDADVLFENKEQLKVVLDRFRNSKAVKGRFVNVSHGEDGRVKILKRY